MTEFEDQISAYRGQLLEIEQQMQSAYDKAVMTLSGGALGISFTFIKDIADKSVLSHTGCLLAAWIMWGLSVTCVLFSFFSSTLAMKRAIKQTDQKLIYLELQGGIWNVLTMILNPIAGMLFFAGVLAISVFMGGNMP